MADRQSMAKSGVTTAVRLSDSIIDEEAWQGRAFERGDRACQGRERSMTHAAVSCRDRWHLPGALSVFVTLVTDREQNLWYTCISW